MDNRDVLEKIECYLLSLISEVSTTSVTSRDVTTPFQELGLDSFHILNIIKNLEQDFGTLPKTLLFENFNIRDLSKYFAESYWDTVQRNILGKKGPVESTGSLVRKGVETTNRNHDHREKPRGTESGNVFPDKHALVLAEKTALADPILGSIVKSIFATCRNESSVSRGTRSIAPNLFIGKDRKGYFHYGRSKEILLAYAFTGPREQIASLAAEMYRHCESRKLEFNLLSDYEVDSIDGVPFSSTPFGVIQRIVDLREFSLRGNKMRRLRYQVTRFEQEGVCRTVEYACGTDQSTDVEIARIIDLWCSSKTMVNPLIYAVKQEILDGTLAPEHRVFLTYLNDELQNVILISSLGPQENGYLMDLEFYSTEMPLGGLEYAIVQIITKLTAEGATTFSLGGTYGCKLEPSGNADPEVDRILDTLREQNLFNDDGNFQFKNKFRPENRSIYLCRPKDNSNPDNVVDIIMMIADPERMQTPERDDLLDIKEKPREPLVTDVAVSSDLLAKRSLRSTGSHHSAIDLLATCDYNPMNADSSTVAFDLLTDSWSQLRNQFIAERSSYLRSHIQMPVETGVALKEFFPFEHIVLTKSGRAAERVFCSSFERKGIVLENLLFPTTIYHQIDNGFIPTEIPAAAVYDADSDELHKGNLDWGLLVDHVRSHPDKIAYVCIEVDNNATGGGAVSIEHLERVRTLLEPRSIPIVLDATRVLENAQFLREADRAYASVSLRNIGRKILEYGDHVIASLTKDFCVKTGGVVATNDGALYRGMVERNRLEGTGLDVLDRKMVALGLQSDSYIEKQVHRRIACVARLWDTLQEAGLPVVGTRPGGHCVLLDVKRLPEFSGFEEPVASCIAWVFLNTGIRIGEHNTGMKKQSLLAETVRIAVPLGMQEEEIDSVGKRLTDLFRNPVNVPDLREIPSADAGEHSGFIRRYRMKTLHRESDLEPEWRSAFRESEATVRVGTQPLQSNFGTVHRGKPTSHRGRVAGPVEIAIVGMAGRYPKAKTLDELWDNLKRGRDCIETIGEDRLAQRLHNQLTKKYRGGFIDDVDRFDSLFFNIPPVVAEMFDPQERLLLEVAWEALEDAGYYPEILGGGHESAKIGVFVGAVWTMYQLIGPEEKMVGHDVNPNSFLWSVSNRISYCMNFSGPSMTVDTACSSSLTALYLACESVSKGECSAAIVGGVNLDLHQSKFDINSFGGALSEDGVCRSFGRGANGYVAGEGVGALMIKPLVDAEASYDNIHGVIKSVRVNHGGRTSGYMVPNPHAQGGLVKQALEHAQVDARSIGYIEAHGTGTELGDPIEISGLNAAFKDYGVEKQSCPVGSVKTNIGHLEAGAGVVGIHKVLLQMRHRKIVPSLHSSRLNEHIDFESSSFYVPQALEEWTPRRVDGQLYPLRAGVSSFGAGGSNAHVILEEYRTDTPTGKDDLESDRELVFPLSARREEELRQAATRLIHFLERSDALLSNIAYTLQCGRKSFEYRMAVIAGTKHDLLEALQMYLNGKVNDRCLLGQAKNAESFSRVLGDEERDEFLKIVSRNRNPRKPAQLWIDGFLHDWQGGISSARGKRISLPTYPFSDKRHWVERSRGIVLGERSRIQPLHPLIDTNESTLERQVFRKVFTDEQFFIYDHLVSGISTLPGVAYLDLVRKAGELAVGAKVRKIRNVVWVSPLTVENDTPTVAYAELKPKGEELQFEVFSEENAEERRKLYCQGTLTFETEADRMAESEYLDIESIRSRCVKVIDGPDAYPLFDGLGLKLGESFQVLSEVLQGDNEVLGLLRVPSVRLDDFEEFLLHPSLLDGTGQSGMAAQIVGQSNELFVPYSFGEVEVLEPLPRQCYSYVTKVTEPGAKVSKANILLLGEDGKVLVRIRDSVGVPIGDLHEKKTDEGSPFDLHYYYPVWEDSPFHATAQSEAANISLLLFNDSTTIEASLGERLGANSQAFIRVRTGSEFRRNGDREFEINPTNERDFERLFKTLSEESVAFEAVCFAWPVSAQPFDSETDILKATAERLDREIYSYLYLCKSLVEAKKQMAVRLLYLHGSDENDVQPLNEAIVGFNKSLKIEHPSVSWTAISVIDGNRNHEAVAAAAVTELGRSGDGDLSLRYAGERRQSRTFKRFDAELRPSFQLPRVREKGVYLVTGGAGGLGLIFANYLVREYKVRLMLTGRSALTEPLAATLRQLSDLGGDVRYVSADISIRSDAQRVVKVCCEEFGDINGIIHSAGVLRDSFMRKKSRDQMSDVLAPKVFGPVLLDELTRNMPLDFFILFSSMASVGGNIGQCDYAFANHFMDSFAHNRDSLRSAGKRFGKTLSVNWSPWAQGGMKLDEQTELFFRNNLGIIPLSDVAGIRALEFGLTTDMVQFAVADGNREKIESAWGLRKAALSAPITPVAVSAKPQESEGTVDTKRAVESALIDIVVKLLKVDAEDVAREKILLDLGFDSIGLTTYANEINTLYGLDITPVLFFEYPSISELSAHLSSQYGERVSKVHGAVARAAHSSATPEPREPAPAPSSETALNFKKSMISGPERTSDRVRRAGSFSSGSANDRFHDMPIAVVGISGVMPQSENVREFWKNLRDAKNLITEVPSERWDWREYDGDPVKEKNKTNSRWGGFMKDVDKFDPLFFGIAPLEAETMDPQQRIFLEQVWKAIEDSGHRPSELAGTKTGLFVGAATHDYSDLMNGLGVPLEAYTAPGNSHAMLANRVSFQLNLHGPSAPIDTACSSSLIALHRAVQSIHVGECEAAIVGGVQVILTPAGHLSFGMAGALSSDGKCKTFDSKADGYVRGEGVGAIYIKPLAKAEEDSDHTYAVVKATAENHGGKVTMLTAPNPTAQSNLIIEAYEKAGVDPSTVGMIECHGTGTSLGDPIEAQALIRAFAELYRKHNMPFNGSKHCALTAVKSNIGHLETGAGIAGLLKTLLALKNRQIPAMLHFEKINPYINFDNTPFYVADMTVEWKASVTDVGDILPRRAGVSSFGFGGANAHIVLEEYMPSRAAPMEYDGEPRAVVLSARDPERLIDYARSLLLHLEEHSPDLSSLAFTLQVGRDEMRERLAFVADSLELVRSKLSSFLDNKSNGGLFIGTVKNRTGSVSGSDSTGMDEHENLAYVEDRIRSGDIESVCRVWVEGAKIDWVRFYPRGNPQRVSLPTYPFARDRLWFNQEAGEKNVGFSQTARLHPLLHENATILSRQRYRSLLRKRDLARFGLIDRDETTVSTAFSLELARVALIHATLGRIIHRRVMLHDIEWSFPLSVAESFNVTVALEIESEDTVAFSVFADGQDSDDIYCEGLGRLVDEADSPYVNIEGVRRQMKPGSDKSKELEKFLEPLSILRVRDASRIIETLSGEGQALVGIQLPDAPDSDLVGYGIHPTVLAVVHRVCVFLFSDGDPDGEQQTEPTRAGFLEIVEPCSRDTFAWVRFARGGHPRDGKVEMDVALMEPSGRICAWIKSMQFTNNESNVERVRQREDFEKLLAEIADEPSEPLSDADQLEFFLKRIQGAYVPAILMFPGLGVHYTRMGQGLYESDKEFQRSADECFQILMNGLDLDLKEVLYPSLDTDSAGASSGGNVDLFGSASGEPADAGIDRIAFNHPMVFIVEYALTRSLMVKGVKPSAMIGYSIGEYVAACLSGVMALEDALILVARRAELIERLPAGAMLAVPLSEERILEIIDEKLSLAAVSGQSFCVVSGPEKDVADFAERLKSMRVFCRKLQTSYAFHSTVLSGIAEEFLSLLRDVKLSCPSIPYISNVTGEWVTDAQAVDPEYWMQHSVNTVRFHKGIKTLSRLHHQVYVEVGPGQSLSSLVQVHPNVGQRKGSTAIPCMRNGYDQGTDEEFLRKALGKLRTIGTIRESMVETLNGPRS